MIFLNRLLILAVVTIAFHSGVLLRSQQTPSQSDMEDLRAASVGNRKSGPLDKCEGGCHLITYNSWWVDMPSLPGQRSDLILVGTTDLCGARLSKDKTTTFTECSVGVRRVIKDPVQGHIAEGSTVVIAREGGLVKLGGSKLGISISGQHLPQSDKLYLFFLQLRPDTSEYLILTSYMLSPSGVRAVDEPPSFHSHDGKSENTFIQDVISSTYDESKYSRQKAQFHVYASIRNIPWA